MRILIKNGTIVNPYKTEKADVLIEDGIIAAVRSGISEKADTEMNAAGKYLIPGLIDIHAHLRTPGREDEEDLESGSHAGAKGGFTTICCMPNTDPPLDAEGLIAWIREEAQRIGIVDIYPVGAITRHRQGQELTEFGAFKRAGCIALSDDGSSVADSALLRRALEYAKMFAMPIISHCEDATLSRGGAMRESFISSKYGISATPDISETIIVARDIALAQYTGGKLHCAHISCAKSIDVIRRGKKALDSISCETAPHYCILTVDDVARSGFSGDFKVNPPLGEAHDVAAIKKALKEGVIDCIATDHAPHSIAEKEVPFEEAPCGFIGLELALSLVYTHLVKGEPVLTLEEVVQKMSANPARILGLDDRGSITEGKRADIAVVDLEKTWIPGETTLVSKSINTPFLHTVLAAVVEATLCHGNIVYTQTGK